MSSDVENYTRLDELKHAELCELIREIGRLKEKQKAVEAKIKSLEGPLREGLAGLGPVYAEPYLVAVTSSAGRATYNTKLMLADLSDAGYTDTSVYVKKGKPFTTLKLTRLRD